MNKNIVKRTGIIIISIIGAVYIIFLMLPLFLNGIINSYLPEINKMVEQAGFKADLDNVKFVTTPKLTAGIKAEHADIMLPTEDSILNADNIQITLSIFPLLARKIELDCISAQSINVNLKVKKDGTFLLEDYMPEQENTDNTETTVTETTVTALPFGFKLSNHLPDIYISNYNISFVDIPTSKIYSINGNQINITDFILDKSIKVYADGKVILDNRTQFNYDIKLLNRIMPDLELNDLVFNPAPAETSKETQPVMINVIDVFKALYNNQLTADVSTDLKITGTPDDMKFKGNILIDKLGIAVDNKKLPDSTIGMEFENNHIKMNTKLYSAADEITQILGDFKTGKHPKINLNFKSNAGINSLIAIIDSVAKSFNYNDLDTLSATGKIDADFSIKSDLKKVESSGYFKIPSSNIKYPLYNIALDNINADVDFADSMVNIKNAGLTVFSHPLKIYGTIKQDATADLHLIADKLQIKSLIAAAGQLGLLKDNDFKSGTISADAALNGKLNKPELGLDISVDNVNIKNIPSQTSVILPSSTVNFKSVEQSGVINASQIKIINPMASLSIPSVKVTAGQKDIILSDTYLLLNNSRIDVEGKISDYLSSDIKINLTANGNIIASDIRNMLPADLRSMVRASGKMPLNINITGNDKKQNINVKLTADSANYLSLIEVDQLKGQKMTVNSSINLAGSTLELADTYVSAGSSPLVVLSGTISDIYSNPYMNLKSFTNKQLGFVIPGFNDSKALATANLAITGTLNNPALNGSVDMSSIKIPSMLVEIAGLKLDLAGAIANGKGTLKKLKSGGIVAENLAADFSLKNYNVLYLNNITGEAFSGTINGNVAYNIAKNSAAVDITGSNMNALKAIEGAAGIKNALSGTLGFDAKLSLNLADETEMMKSLKGSAEFQINDGSLLNIGRLENFLLADNIKSNSIMNAAVSSISALPTVKNTAQFKTISGKLSFANGWANIQNIKTSGHSMSYYITGKYNLLNGTANMVILGRLSAEVVKLLGPIGELSVDKLTSFIPKFGNLTASVLKTMTTNPRGEKTSELPALSSGETNYKDFKVIFNGGIESKSSVKSFKWLSECDTSAIESVSIKEQIQNTTQAIKDAHKTNVENFKNSIEEVKKQNEAAKQQLQNIQNNLKNLFKPKTDETTPSTSDVPATQTTAGTP